MKNRRSRRVRLFVGATPDLEAERDIVGRVVAKLPVSIGWELKRTPLRGGPRQPGLALSSALEAVSRCDLYLFMLGRDISAWLAVGEHAGVEWDLARRTGREMVVYEKDVLHTPARRTFVRNSHRPWTRFGDDEDLARSLRSMLARHLLKRAIPFGLSAMEHEALRALLDELADGETDAAGPAVHDGQMAGVASGGIILGPSDLPAGGVQVE